MDNTNSNPLKILVAVDESEPGHHSLHQALQLINLREATFLLLSVEAPVMMPPMPSASFGPGVLDTDISSSWDEAALLKLQEQRTQSTIQWAQHLCEQAGVQYVTQTEFGDPKHVICEVAKHENPDLIVVGSHGYGMVERVLIGSVSDYVVHHAQCPVLVVR